jgi:hypothetical protein
MGTRVIAVIDWRAAGALKDNARFLERAGLTNKARPKDKRLDGAKYRSLAIRDDGSCELQRWSVAAAARRLGGAVQPVAMHKARVQQRG